LLFSSPASEAALSRKSEAALSRKSNGSDSRFASSRPMLAGRRHDRAVVTAVTAKAAKPAINRGKDDPAASASPWRHGAQLRMIGAGSSRGRSDEAARQSG
jgi:hypothetical protein